MPSVTLNDRDVAILERLSDGAATVEDLAESTSIDPVYLRTRLPALADNGVVERDDGDRYSITPSGSRALAGTPAGRMDDRIDTPADVERAIASFDLRPDREAALRSAFAFLRYWGEAHESEIVDAVYSEAPAGFDSRTEWWTDFVRERLAQLPPVDPPDDPVQSWRYTGQGAVEAVTEDGRRAPDADVSVQPSAKYALETASLDEGERDAVRAAFAVLLEEGTAGADAIRERAYPDAPADYEAATDWWDECVRERLADLPGVDRIEDGDRDDGDRIEDGDRDDGDRIEDGDRDDGETVWRYRQVATD